MVLIKVQYDAYNRQFKLVDREFAHTLLDGESYLLIADLAPEEDSPTNVEANGGAYGSRKNQMLPEMFSADRVL